MLEDKTVAASAAAAPDSFLILYDRYFSRVYNYVRYRCMDAQVADDLTAQAFLKALTRIETFNPDKAPFEAWLFAIVRNLVNDFYRHKMKFNLVDLEDVENMLTDTTRPTMEEKAEQREEKLRLLRCLDTLTPRQRDLIALKFASEMSNRDIAKLTGLTEQNVGVMLHRSIKQLRKRMEEEEKP
ncbi:MAG: sigma-70 family RNA polymerase sigma factor [Anaerolineae bacterium]|nr:sigma-70 family RNA polymerase sigma factor [Anaerolineae bacterium]